MGPERVHVLSAFCTYYVRYHDLMIVVSQTVCTEGRRDRMER